MSTPRDEGTPGGPPDTPPDQWNSPADGWNTAPADPGGPGAGWNAGGWAGTDAPPTPTTPGPDAPVEPPGAGPPAAGPDGAPTSGAPPYGTPAYGAPAPGAPAYGAPPYGTPAYGAPAPGAPPYGTPAYGAPAPGAPPYGTPAYGAPAPGAPAYGAPAYGAPGQPPPAAKRSKAPLIIGLVILLVVLGVGGALAWRFVQGSDDLLADRVPADAVFYGHVNLNPSASNKLGIRSLIDRINAAAGEDLIDIDSLLGELEMDSDGITFAADIDPWLGDQVAFYAPELPLTDEAQEADDQQFAAVVAVDDADAAAAFIQEAGNEGPWDAGGGRTGWVLSGDDGGVAVIDDGVMYVGTEAAVLAGLGADATLADAERFAPVIDALPDRVITLWVDTPALLESFTTQTGDDLPFDAPGATALAISFSQGALDVTSTTLTPDGTAFPAADPVAALPLESLPGDGLLYVRVPDLGAQLGGFLDGLDGAAMAAEEAGQMQEDVVPSQVVAEGLEEALGTSVQEIAGWLGDVTLALGYDPARATDNAGVLLQAGVSDTQAAADLVDALAEQIPPDAGIDVADGRISAGDASIEASDGRLAIRAGTFGTGTLGDDAAYQAALDGLDGAALLYVDISRTVRAIAAFTASGGTPDAETQQGLDIAAAFDALVVAAGSDGEVLSSTLRLTFGSDLRPVEVEGEPNLPDIDFGELGTVEDVLAGSSGPQDEPAQPNDPTTPTGDEPFTFGDDPDLDTLWTACTDGDFLACDDLYLVSPVGSDYESYGLTCGDRVAFSASCVEEFGQ